MQNWSKRNGHCVKICEAQPWNASDGTFWSLAGKCACNFGLTRRRCTQQKPHWQHTSNILRRLNQLNQVAAIRLFDYLTIELFSVKNPPQRNPRCLLHHRRHLLPSGLWFPQLGSFWAASAASDWIPWFRTGKFGKAASCPRNNSTKNKTIFAELPI